VRISSDFSSSEIRERIQNSWQEYLSKYGNHSEYDAFGKNEIESGDYAEDVAAQMLASSLGIPFDIDKSWDEKRQQWTISGQIYKTKNVTQSAKGNKDGKWTTVFAAAVLVL